MGMNLEELVRLTLNNIVEGSVGAQVYASEAGASIGGGGADSQVRVEFDIAIQAELSGKTTAGSGRRITVLDPADVKEGDPVTRVRFGVPVELPEPGADAAEGD